MAARIYSADLETTTDKDDCRCWAWASVDIFDTRKENVEFGNTIEGFFRHCVYHPGLYYFHNLKFDGHFILDYLLRHDYQFVLESKCLQPGQFSALISDMGTWYSLTVCFKCDANGYTQTIEYRDSLKIIPLSVEEIPDAYGLSHNKLKLDYKKYRPPGHILTDSEKEYISADVVIVGDALRFMYEHSQSKMTAASNALNDFKTRLGKKEYTRLFPKLDSIIDRDVRLSYKGGWTYLNPKYRNEPIGVGTVFDVNSMYPWAMKYCKLPYGEAVYFIGPYKQDKLYDLYVINFECTFKLKPGHYPSIQKKGTGLYQDNEYIEETIKPITLTLTSVDFELLLFNYDVTILEYHFGYMWKSKVGMFAEYVDYWFEQKTIAKKTGNKGLEKIAKLMLNSLYGKFGSKPFGKSKIPYLDKNKDCVRFTLSAKQERKGGYLPVATFITSYCRDKINRGAYACGDDFIYADTDSLHIKGTKIPSGLDVDTFRLGAFKVEEEFKRAKFIRQKTYLEMTDAVNEKGEPIELMNLKCCGMPRKMKDSISEEEFNEGAIFDPADKTKHYAPKLIPKVVPGGVILRETTFQIKKAKTVNAY